MALKAYKERTFKATLKFEDGSTREVEFRLPKSTDIYSSGDGNTNIGTLYTLANMAKPLEKSVQVEVEDGSLLNIKTVGELIDLGVIIDFSDALEKWLETKKKAQEEKEYLLKKSKSHGNSEEKAIPQQKD